MPWHQNGGRSQRNPEILWDPWRTIATTKPYLSCYLETIYVKLKRPIRDREVASSSLVSSAPIHPSLVAVYRSAATSESKSSSIAARSASVR